MRITIAGNTFRGHPNRIAGTYQIAYDVMTVRGEMGKALLVYEFDDRDVILEKLFVTPNIADEVRGRTLPSAPSTGEGPCCSGFFPFPEEGDENRNIGEVTKAKKRCTQLVYSA